MMKVIRLCAGAATILALRPSVSRSESQDSDPSQISRDSIRLHHCTDITDVALEKAAGIFAEETGIDIKISMGMRSLDSRGAWSTADILWDIAETEIAMLLEDYGSLAWSDTTPINSRPDVTAGHPALWRDVNVVLTSEASPAANSFLNFLTSDRGAAILRTTGWIR